MGKKKTNRGEIEKPGLLDDPDVTSTIESKIEVESITLKNKRWRAKLIINTILPRSYHLYSITLEVDEAPYLKRIEDLQRGLDESLFKEERVSKKKTIESINNINKELAQMKKDCETIKFGATVEEIKYRDGDTLLACRIPDDVIEPLNRQKYRMEAYKIGLTPIFYPVTKNT